MNKYEFILIVKGLTEADNKRKLHISLNNRRFYNGVVSDTSDEMTFSFFDNKIGQITLLYNTIINIEPWKKR